MEAKVDALERRFDAKINAVEAKIDVLVARLETKIADSQATLIKWFIATAVTTTGLAFAIAKYVH